MKILFGLLIIGAVGIGSISARYSRAFIHNSDTTLGRLLKTWTTEGQFVGFAKSRSDEFQFRDASNGFTISVIFGAPEMDCFLANHAKDDLRLTYEIYDRQDSLGKTIRTSKATRIVSLKSGDDTKTWAAKEQADSSLLLRHHEQLKKAREEM